MADCFFSLLGSHSSMVRSGFVLSLESSLRCCSSEINESPLILTRSNLHSPLDKMCTIICTCVTSIYMTIQFGCHGWMFTSLLKNNANNKALNVGSSLPSTCLCKWKKSSSDMWENLQLGPKSQIPKKPRGKRKIHNCIRHSILFPSYWINVRLNCSAPFWRNFLQGFFVCSSYRMAAVSAKMIRGWETHQWLFILFSIIE